MYVCICVKYLVGISQVAGVHQGLSRFIIFHSRTNEQIYLIILSGSLIFHHIDVI